MNKILLFFVATSLLFLSCSKDDSQAEIDRNTILSYIDANDIDAVEHPSGLYYVIENQGSGGSPTLSDSVKVQYTGFITEGLIFDQTPEGETRSFLLDDLIPGWEIGIPLVEKGGEIKLILPSALAYGSQGQLANRVLIFDIVLEDFGF
ncbi:MAG: FKBP-type peptidyl-prolyl cis-trans isomerase [Saprospiraceae bacterium]|jgi:FKBP-type peptidyl-prolyl cis-trans isomerase|nr:FKBP-type peptidyl-prolyl cis-trans isomerase [Saprospiraceae bacterium]